MESIIIFRLTLIAIISIGVLLLVLSTFSRPWVFAEWVKMDFWIVGFAGLAWTPLKLTLLFGRHHVSGQTHLFLDHIGTLLSGVVLGLVALFFLSGEAVLGIKRWRELKRESRQVNRPKE